MTAKTLASLLGKNQFVSWQSEDGQQTVTHVKGMTVHADFEIPENGTLYFHNGKKLKSEKVK